MKDVYLLNNHVYFNAAAGLLSTSLCFSNKVSLSRPATNCLKLLITRQGDLCAYPYLSRKIWGDRGKWITNNTLHQHIYQLRNSLKKAGIQEEAIITVPRKGFQLCPHFSASPIDEIPPVTDNQTASSKGPDNQSGIRLSLRFFYTLLIFNALLMLILIAILIHN